ncbi:MAG TPA: serine hydrolase domain-containing protein [Candidatus Limnocylindrales bacterium]|nr:serine hydrolase domain-containing protein [Candidatus Limnocylindrales bacterium]
MSLEAALTSIDAIADRTFAGWKVPGLAYGVTLGDRLIHSRGLGTLRVGEEAPPDADSVFRIASMTKSFTAATVLLLRDEGRLRLDDPIGEHVPELAKLRGPTADSPPISIRHLLTMTAGFPTDDPWGDRQQGLDLASFAELLRGGLSFAWTPDLRFEYSNLGYGILGRAITNVAGHEYREVVTERLLRPLVMTSTTFLEGDVPASRLAHGYLWRDEAFCDEPSDPYGALASMGGVFSSVRDLARWVGGFVDAFPPRDEAEGRHPLRRASRREMQQPQRAFDPVISAMSTDSMLEFQGGAYAFGLVTIDHLAYGRIVGHSGGYPGFGSNMRWHPSSGLGVVVLANGRYAPATPLGKDLLEGLLATDAVPSRRVRPVAATEAARATIERLLERWDEEAVDRLCAMNLELDEPIARRRAVFDKVRASHGALRPDPDAPAESLSPFHLAWWMRGERGRVQIEIQLSPEREPRVQTLNLTSVPEPPAALVEAATLVRAALDDVAPAWPSTIALADTVDRALLHRSVLAAAARFAPIERQEVVAGDGVKTASFRFSGARGKFELRMTLDPGTARLTRVVLVPMNLEPPTLAD